MENLVTKGTVFDKGQTENSLTEQGKSGQGISGGQSVGDNGKIRVGKRTDELFESKNELGGGVEILCGQMSIFREEIR
jgi:hypothetical protein